ncbi:urate oxidase [Chitinophaga sp. YR573]|uniref:factor-independent urate hydroxylase n=1 Tax=Chitinophaga sp. YR573 TaxID=1881040 RepID=UPI0008D73532|nr:urate oxidase [Chitinophaga sp. YR573]SEW36666.1 urate oxidase [Chitinophaga sp. YR573]
MSAKLTLNSYGKNAVNLSKVIRHADHHEFRQITVNVSLEGNFTTAYTEGDNTKILATDTQKNTVYALAKEHFTSSIEAFGIYLSDHFIANNPQVTQVTIDITEHGYTRMAFDGSVHAHAYIGNGPGKNTALVVQDRENITVRSGVKDLLILKTTDSGFENFIRDEYTSLKETADRILATQCAASWLYISNGQDFEACAAAIRNTLLKTFAFHKSLSVQQTLYAMGEAVLQEHSMVKEISLQMPNKHHIPFNMEQFGLSNKNDIFIATDEPYGLIHGTITRG